MPTVFLDTNVFLYAVGAQHPLADISVTCDLMDRYPALPTRDAIHAATMLNNGISDIITSDGHFDAVRGIRRLPLAGYTP
jgi:predicted nucleic acid-binding protein